MKSYSFVFLDAGRVAASFDIVANNPLEAVEKAFVRADVQSLPDNCATSMQMFCNGDLVS